MKFKRHFSILLLCMFFSSNSYGQTGPELSVNSKVVYDDNIFRVDDARSDSIFIVSPNAEYTGKYQAHTFNAVYQGDYALYKDNSSVNYTNHRLASSIDLVLTQKWRTRAEFEYINQIEQPGSTNTVVDNVDEFVQFSQPRINIVAEYGQQESIGQFRTSYSYRTVDFKNNNQEFRNTDRHALSGTFFYRVATKTRALIELAVTDVEAEQAVSSQSFLRYALFTGVSFNSSSALRGSARIGYQNTQYKNVQIEDLGGLSYFVDLRWSPNQSSTFSTALSRSSNVNAEQSFASLETTDFRLTWDNKLRNKFSLSASVNFRNDDFSGSFGRSDKTKSVSLGLNYDAYAWLGLYTQVSYAQRDSNDDIYQYKNNKISFGVNLYFD